MIAFEVALLLVAGIVIVVGIRAIAKPLTEAYAERMKFQFRELGSESEVHLKNKVAVLEDEVMNLKKDMKAVQESLDYAIKQLESTSQTNRTIKLSEQKENSQQ